jgi:hypothetical protein
MLAAGLAAALGGLAEIYVALISVGGLYAGMKIASHSLRRLEDGGMTPYIVDIRVNLKSYPES